MVELHFSKIVVFMHRNLPALRDFCQVSCRPLYLTVGKCVALQWRPILA